MSALGQTEPGLSGRDLVTRMGISKQAVSQLIETLVTMGYVTRRPAPDDRRRTLLHLTARGRSAARIIDRTVAEMEAPWRPPLAATTARAPSRPGGVGRGADGFRDRCAAPTVDWRSRRPVK